jgi:hypothetical protein
MTKKETKEFVELYERSFSRYARDARLKLRLIELYETLPKSNIFM